MEYNPINALKMKSFSGYTPKKPYRWAVTNVCCQFLCIPVIPEKSFVTRGYKHVGMRLAYFACPYPYVFVKRECPRDAKLFYGITENQKVIQTSCNVCELPPYVVYYIYLKFEGKGWRMIWRHREKNVH